MLKVHPMLKLGEYEFLRQSNDLKPGKASLSGEDDHIALVKKTQVMVV